jgi:molecular chaperone DnaK (HSP70)
MARIGIDLGTTNTVAAMVYDDGAHVIPRGRGRIIPSAVHFRWQEGDDDVLVGEEAAKWMAEGRVVRSVKRLMGRQYAEALGQGSARYFKPDRASVRLVRRGDSDLGLEIGGTLPLARTLWPHEVTAWVLREARAHAERSLGRSIEAASVTVPAYFRDAHRAATLDAARLAGIDVWGDLLDEPTAAALAFAPVVGLKPGEPVLVVDWGGGTLDVTVLMSRGAEWQQAAIGGDIVLGGDDLDRAIAAWALERTRLPSSLLEDEAIDWMLCGVARQAKEALSARDEATVSCGKLVDPDTGKRLRPIAQPLSRAELERVIGPLVERAVACVDATLDKPDANRAAIRKVLLVGGSTHVPLFRRRLAELLPAARFHDEVDPMEAVALGAALYAHQPPRIARICPFGYAVVLDDDTREDVIPVDTDVPTPAHAPFAVTMKTRYPAQTVYRVTLAAFEEGREGRTYHEPRTLFARGLPQTAVGTHVDVELSLDGNKDLSARCHVDSRAGAHAMEGRREGNGELFTRLLNATLDGEALVEANERNATGLMPRVRRAVEWAQAAEQAGDREQAGQALEQLRDLHDQVEDRHRVTAEAGLPPELAARRRALGWVWFYEKDLLPHFWDALAPGHRDECLARVRALRIQLQTGAGADELEDALMALRSTACSGDLEPALRAWATAGLLGMPDRMADQLRAAATRVRDAYVTGDEEAFAEETAAVHVALARAGDAWNAWRETGALLDARPDLVLVRRDHVRPN